MDLNKSNMKKILGVITFAVLLYVGVQHINLVGQFIGSIFSLIFPFVLGAGIAFILNVPMRAIENMIFRKKVSKNIKLQNMKRPISFLVTLIIVIGVIFLVSFLVIPEIGRTIMLISDQLPAFYARILDESTALVEKYPDIANYINGYNMDWEEILSKVYDFVANSGLNMLQSTFSVATSILGGVFNFLLGFVFAIYILLQKEKLGQESRKLVYAYLPEKAADKIVSVCSLSASIFAKFLSGQCLEAVILGMMFFLAMSIFQFPYALMISVLIAFTALIPIFGAFIGCVIGAFLILIVDPVMALWFIVMFLIIQQIEGNLIYPRVVGGSIGLPGTWVLVAVTVGGSTMGVPGMLIFIPMSSVLYTLLREAVNYRIEQRKIPKEKI
ncbi:MAG: AI-2E family transporter [Mobilitalea sp.]